MIESVEDRARAVECLLMAERARNKHEKQRWRSPKAGCRSLTFGEFLLVQTLMMPPPLETETLGRQAQQTGICDMPQYWG
jgi:hypothetical protein